MNTHAEIALQLLTTSEPKIAIATVSARQGDILLRRTGDADPAKTYRPLPAKGILVGKGNHGEHRLGNGRYAKSGTVVHLPDGGRLVHTDEPHARHAPILLLPGSWRITRQREYVERRPRAIID